MVKSISYESADGIRCTLKNSSRLMTIKMLLIGSTKEERDRVPALIDEVNGKAAE